MSHIEKTVTRPVTVLGGPVWKDLPDELFILAAQFKAEIIKDKDKDLRMIYFLLENQERQELVATIFRQTAKQWPSLPKTMVEDALENERALKKYARKYARLAKDATFVESYQTLKNIFDALLELAYPNIKSENQSVQVLGYNAIFSLLTPE